MRVWKVSGGCLEGVWKVSGCLRKVSVGCLVGVWRVSEGSLPIPSINIYSFQQPKGFSKKERLC